MCSCLTCGRSVIDRRMRNEQIVIILIALAFLPGFKSDSSAEIKLKKADLVKKHLKRLKKQEGAIKLVGGREEYEG